MDNFDLTKLALDSKIIDVTQLDGGCTTKTALITTTQQSYILKCLPNAPRDFFITEQKQLNFLAETGLFIIPKVFAATQDYLLIEYLKPLSTTNWPEAAQKLVKLHHLKNSRYGFPFDTFIGTLVQNNTWQADWAVFYIEQRLRPLLNHPLLTMADRHNFELLFERLPQLLANISEPVLLHGDLWQNNILFTAQGIGLIDPALHYGPREMDLAYIEFNEMHELFSEYQKQYPLPDSYERLKPIYYLYPLLFHLHLQSPDYLAKVRAAVQQVLSLKL